MSKYTISFKEFMEWQGNNGGPGELRFPKIGGRSYHAAGIRSKWTSQGMKKKQKKMKKK